MDEEEELVLLTEVGEGGEGVASKGRQTSSSSTWAFSSQLLSVAVQVKKLVIELLFEISTEAAIKKA